MITRREAISFLTLGAAGASVPGRLYAAGKKTPSRFRYCLNTSTISRNSPGIESQVETASEAGYGGVEIWIRDLKSYLDAGKTLGALRRKLETLGLKVESAIGFAPWLVKGEAGFRQMKEEMLMVAELDCRRIAAPPAGLDGSTPLDFLEAGETYHRLLDLGRETGVMPQLEFWGASPALWHLGQALMIATASDDPGARILPDIYHLFRGGSGFTGLKFLRGDLIEMFHLNDYPGDKPRTGQTDADRVYPGDGVAPVKSILSELKAMGGEKVLSLELFNRSYWEKDPLEVARTGLMKMKSIAENL